MAVSITGRFVDPLAATTHFHLHEGDRVADFGAGAGYFLKTLSGAVGESGRVYACDIQKGLVDKIGRTAREAHLSNVEPLWCDFEKKEGTTLRDQALDAGLLVNTLYQLEHKEEALREIARVIQPGGKLFLIDWSESFGGLGPRPEDVVTEETAKELAKGAGFQFERTFEAGEHHYGLAFRRI